MLGPSNQEQGGRQAQKWIYPLSSFENQFLLTYAKT